MNLFVNNTIIILLYYLVLPLQLSDVGNAASFEMPVKSGDYVCVFFKRSNDVESFVPLLNRCHTRDKFVKVNSTMLVEFKLKEDKPLLNFQFTLASAPEYPDKVAIKLRSGNNYIFGSNAILGRLIIEAPYANTLVIRQKFTDTETKSDNELVVIVSKNIEWIKSNVYIPKSYMLWTWEFFELFNDTLDN